MNRMQHPSEEDLTAYQLHESADETAIRKHLELCDDCAALSESIAGTLRVFSAEPVPQADLDRNWQRLRGNLGVLGTAERRGFHLPSWVWPAAAFAAAAAALLLFVTLKPRHADRSSSEMAAFRRAGPLSATPVDPHVDSQIAQQLDSAERLLTEVNHTSGPLDDATRLQAHDLLVRNAVYIHSAREHGDLGTASVLEDLDHVLTNMEHEPKSEESEHTGWHLRLEMNTQGLLLDIRILRQNDARQ